MKWIVACLLVCSCLLTGCEGPLPGEAIPSAEVRVVPWQRTEERAPCTSFNRLRTPYFGDLHIHTRFSADAYIFGTRGDPRDAYRFAQGESISVADDNEQQTRSVHLDRPLDFAAVTDHSEFYGEVRLCDTPDSPVYNDHMCQILREADDPNNRFLTGVAWLYPAGIDNPPKSHMFCFLPGIDCDAAAVSVWKDIQAAAEEAYDRSESCNFTTFIGYEHTASPLGRHLHRNVIFRNHHVPAFASSQLETAADGIPQGVWKAVERDCLNAGDGCDAVIIPHNSNLSEGRQFQDPADGVEAQRRQDREPLAEIHQMKGNSECRYDRVAGKGTQTADELCAFEQLPNAHEGPDAVPLPADQYPARNMIRNALKDGLRLEGELGVNPFRFGFIGSTDSHNATGGNTEEIGWEGGEGNSDSSPARQIGNDVRNNPGGLAVVWAEENSRDAIFSALRRRETYATTGTRPVVRFFAGALDGVDCGNRDFIEASYRGGGTMGSEIGPVRGGASPRFAVYAAKDPGTSDVPGTDLQRAQIVKGWVDAQGDTHERVFDVAGNPDNGASVDSATCAPTGTGSRELCTIWEDPEFDRSERAFYYVRVLENPTCRWSTLVCKGAGVDPFAADCSDQAARAGAEFADCCVGSREDPAFAPIIQERAWSSPIWYQPEGVMSVAGGIERGRGDASDVVNLEIRLGRLPDRFDRSADAVTIKISDDDTILSVEVPPNGLLPTADPAVFSIAAGTVDGVLSFTMTIEDDDEVSLNLLTLPRDLSAAEDIDHFVTIALQLGESRFAHTRMWRATRNGLSPDAS